MLAAPNNETCVQSTKGGGSAWHSIRNYVHTWATTAGSMKPWKLCADNS